MLGEKGYKAGSTCSEHQLGKSKKMKERAPPKRVGQWRPKNILPLITTPKVKGQGEGDTTASGSRLGSSYISKLRPCIDH